MDSWSHTFPIDVLSQFDKWQVQEFAARVYRAQPVLKKPENDVLALLTWTSIIRQQPPRSLIEWAASHNGWTLHQQLIASLQLPQKVQQIALTVAALLCYKRLLPYGPEDTMQPYNGDYLADLKVLMRGEPVINERIILENMIVSLLRAIGDSDRAPHGMCELLMAVLGREVPDPEPRDRLLSQYCLCRMDEFSHADALLFLRGGKKFTFWLPGLPFLWTAVSAVVLFLSTYGALAPFWALVVLLVSTSGELLTMLIHRYRKRSNRSALSANAFLCFLKFILICIFLPLIKIHGFPASPALFSVSSLVAIQAFRQIHSLRHPSSPPVSFSYKAPDTEKALEIEIGIETQDFGKTTDLDQGRQFVREGNLAKLSKAIDCSLYTTVRLSNLGYRAPLEPIEKFDTISKLHQVLSVLELSDESWEMVVLRSFLPDFHDRVTEAFPGCELDAAYDPTEPSMEDIGRFRTMASNVKPRGESINMEDQRFYIMAKAQKIDAFSSTASTMIMEAWPAASAFYSHLLERGKIWLEENVHQKTVSF